MKKDANGEMKVFAKSYTLCGTPEYLSPELIFNLGHNQSADIWALGVMIYEMLMTITPFAPRRPDNITELFTNIAMVKVSERFSRERER
jgi:serine/threonine protein kinase